MNNKRQTVNWHPPPFPRLQVGLQNAPLWATVHPALSHPPVWNGSSGCGRRGRCPPSLVSAGFGRCVSAGPLGRTASQSVKRQKNKNKCEHTLRVWLLCPLLKLLYLTLSPLISVIMAYSSHRDSSNLSRLSYQIYLDLHKYTTLLFKPQIKAFIYLHNDVSLGFSCCFLVHQEEYRIKCIWYQSLKKNAHAIYFYSLLKLRKQHNKISTFPRMSKYWGNRRLKCIVNVLWFTELSALHQRATHHHNMMICLWQASYSQPTPSVWLKTDK